MWFLDDLQRLAHERAAVTELLEHAGWLVEASWKLDGGMRIDAQIATSKRRYPVRVVFPALYPECPPSVFPQDGDDERWSGHQYGAGGELCTEWGPDTWRPDVTAAQVLTSAHRLLEGEADPIHAPAPSRHSTTIGQDLRTAIFRFGLWKVAIDAIRGLPPRSSCAARCLVVRQREGVLVLLTELQSPSEWKFSSIPKAIARDYPERAALVVRTTLPPEKASQLDLNALVTAASDTASSSRSGEPVGALDEETRLVIIEDREGALYPYWIASDPRRAFRVDVVEFREASITERLGEEAEALATKQVGVVGVGSMGGRIVRTLARSGVRRFVLVDDDVHSPENICRHVLDWRFVAEHKVDAIADDLDHTFADARVDVHRLRLSGQEANASVALALRKLGECDLIVDATANPKTFNYLGATAKRATKPLVWGEVFAGGIGGLVARYRPGRDPSPHLARERIHAWTDQHDAPFPRTKNDYGAVQNDHRVVVAHDAEVGLISSAAAILALDLLLESEPSRFPHSAYAIGLAREWVFSQPFEVLPIPLGSPEQPQVDPNPEAEAESIGFLRELVRTAARGDAENES